ncbi:MAG: PRC-barrel domain-containing protein [Solirubrobacteraceae bacterium]
MSEGTEFRIGSKVDCSDGPCGELKRVVVDPVARAITHLAVEPRHRRGPGRLVPVDRVASTGKEIRLRCTESEFHALDEAEETQLLPGARGQWGYGQDQMFSLPYYRLGMGAVGMGPGGMSMGGSGLGLGMGGVRSSAGPHALTSDRVPVGEVEVRRGDQVHATDGAIGRVQGLVVDPSDYHVTHILLDEGHLWGEKRVTIPISAVKSVDDGVRISLTKDEVRDLPPVDVDHPD